MPFFSNGFAPGGPFGVLFASLSAHRVENQLLKRTMKPNVTANRDHLFFSPNSILGLGIGLGLGLVLSLRFVIRLSGVPKRHLEKMNTPRDQRQPPGLAVTIGFTASSGIRVTDSISESGIEFDY